MQIQRKSTFSLCMKPHPISALFGRIRGRVPQAEARWHPCPTGGHSASCRGCAAKPPHGPAQRWRDGEKMRRSEGESELLRRSKRCRPGAYGARADENRGVEKSAGESPGAFVAPGRSLPPAVRAVSGDGGWRFFGRATIRLTLIMRKETENPVVVGFLMALIPD